MGNGSYSYEDRTVRATIKGYDKKSAGEIFTQRSINNAMSPFGITVRESRDSEDHPNSVAIVLALDETGSMGSVPHFLVKEGLPEMMSAIIKKGILDPQVMFMGIGDHECDKAPLQVGQFESSDELLDKWLTDLYLEGNGGGNGGESYHLAWFFAGRYSEMDCLDKRGQKGFLFTIGDEPVLDELPAGVQKGLMGPGEYKTMSAVELLEMAQKKFNVYHIHIKETSSGSRQHVIDGWKQLLADNLVIANRKTDVAKLITDIVTKNTPILKVEVDKPSKAEAKTEAKKKEDKIML